MKKKILSILLAVSLSIGSIPLYEAKAATVICETYRGENVENQNYSRWSSTIDSYLASCDDGSLMRVQYGSQIEGGLLVEYYDADYNFKSSKIVAEELPIFGGFYETDSNYFIVTGQLNNEQSDTKEVFRITKYDKQWNKVKSAGLSNCNTTVPFDAGSLRMVASGKYLLIRTAHEMYTSNDGYNHQANVTIQVDMDTMEITDSYTKAMNYTYGYVSHSFNQFIKVENNKIVSVDHGDAYPRSIALLKYNTDISTGKFVPSYSNGCTLIDVMSFPGETGQNTTGAAVGGFEISESKYLVAGHSVVQDGSNLTRSTRNVFVAAVDKESSAVTTNWLTSYEEGDGTTSTPHMVKVSDDRYIVLWSRDNRVYYTYIDGTGVKVGDTYSKEGNLSDCVPVVSGEKLIWYTWNENVITFYDINLNDLSKSSLTEMVNGHRYDNKGVSDGIATLKCLDCEKEEQIKVATSMDVWWNSDGGYNYYSSFSRTQEVGNKLYCWIEPLPSEVNTEMEVVSSDTSVISVTMISNTQGVLSMNKAGSATIAIRPKWNREIEKQYIITVTDNSVDDSNIDKGAGTGSDSSTDKGAGTGSDSSTDKGAGTGSDSSTDKGAGTDSDSSTDKGAGTGSDSSTDKGAGTGSDSNTDKNNGQNNSGIIQVGKVVTQNGNKYKVTKVGTDGKGEVEFASVNKNKKTIVIPATVTIDGVKYKVTSIASKAFAKNKVVTKVVIGKNVKVIGKKAFYKCKNIKKITVKSKVLKKVGKKAIKGINKKAVIKVPKKKIKKYKQLFGKKSGYKKSMRIKK